MSDIAFHLAGRGARVSVITSRGLYDDPAAQLLGLEEKHGVEIHRVYRPRFSRDWLLGRAADSVAMYLSFALAVFRLGARGDKLIVKTDPPLLSVALAPVARVKGLVLINWLQDLYPELALSLGLRALKPVFPMLKALRNVSLRIARHNVAIGTKMRNRLESLGVSGDQIAVIPNWCDEESIKPVQAESNALRQAWNLGDKFVVGYSGNLGRAHEYDTLLEAAARLRDMQNIRFLLIGGGHLIASLKADVESRGLGEYFQFRPYQRASMLAHSLSVPDVHWISLRPSMEGLIVPSKFYGIAAAGRPIIAIGDPHGEIAELVEANDCGFVVEPGDGEGLAKLLRRLSEDKGLLQRAGGNARAMIDRSFRRQQAFERWENLLLNSSPDNGGGQACGEGGASPQESVGAERNGRAYLGRRASWHGRLGHHPSS